MLHSLKNGLNNGQHGWHSNFKNGRFGVCYGAEYIFFVIRKLLF